MSGIRIPPAMPPAGFSLNTAMANFEEEKTFFGPMFVVVTPNIRRRVKRNRTRQDREREMSSLGRVIRRFRSAGVFTRKRAAGSYQEEPEQDYPDFSEDYPDLDQG